MKFKAIATAVICATSSLCAPALVVTSSVAYVNEVTVFDMANSLMGGSIRKTRHVSSALQPVLAMGYAQQLLAFKNPLSNYSESLNPSGLFNGLQKPAYDMPAMTASFNKFGDTVSPINFNAVAALSDTPGEAPESSYSFMLLAGLAVMGAIAMRRGSHRI